MRKLSKNNCKQIADLIDNVVINKQHPSIDDLQRFTKLMFELHNKQFDLSGLSMNDFKNYIRNPFSIDAMLEMDNRIEFASELVDQLRTNPEEYLKDL